MPTNEEIQMAYRELTAAYDMAISRALDEMAAREALTNAEASILASDVITGPNAEVRRAKLMLMTEGQREALFKETETKKIVDAAVAICQLEIESYKWQIRNTDNLLREKELRRRNKTNE